MSEGAKGTPASLGDSLMTRRDVDMVNDAQASFYEKYRDERRVKHGFIEEVKNNDELTDIEKTGWLLAVDSEDPESAAEGFIDKLLRVEELVSRPDTPLVYVGFFSGRTAEMIRTDGSGMNVRINGIDGAEIGVNEESHTFRRFPYCLRSIILAEAVTEPEEVEPLDITAHHAGTYSGEHKDVLIIGDEPIKAYFERLLDIEEERGGRLLQSYWVEDLLIQLSGDAKSFLADSERLMQWYEEMRTSRVNLAAECMLSRQSRFYNSPSTSPEKTQVLADFYGIDYEEARVVALRIHDESTAEVRRRLETAQPFLATDSDRLRYYGSKS